LGECKLSFRILESTWSSVEATPTSPPSVAYDVVSLAIDTAARTTFEAPI